MMASFVYLSIAEEKKKGKEEEKKKRGRRRVNDKEAIFFDSLCHSSRSKGRLICWTSCPRRRWITPRSRGSQVLFTLLSKIPLLLSISFLFALFILLLRRITKRLNNWREETEKTIEDRNLWLRNLCFPGFPCHLRRFWKIILFKEVNLNNPLESSNFRASAKALPLTSWFNVICRKKKQCIIGSQY